jgi:hypothetical protein
LAGSLYNQRSRCDDEHLAGDMVKVRRGLAIHAKASD